METRFSAEVVAQLLVRRLLTEDLEEPLWWRFNWVRPYALLRAVEASDVAPSSPAVMAISPGCPGDIHARLRRRSPIGFRKDAIRSSDFDLLVDSAAGIARGFPGFIWYAIPEAVADNDGRIRRIDARTTATLEIQAARGDIRTLAQGQSWFSGGGAAFVLALSWSALPTTFGDSSRGYVSALINIGRAAHHLVGVAVDRGLGARMTPALDEAVAARMLALPSTEEALYLIKVGLARGESDIDAAGADA